MPPRQSGDCGVQVVKTEATPLLGDECGRQHDGVADAGRSAVPSMAALAFTMLTQSFLLVGVFPYSGFLAMHLVPSLDEESAGRYAGLVASSFMVGRTLTSFHWGRAADRHGRTFAIRMSLLLSAVFSVLFGLAPTLPLALLARFALGLSNGLIGSIKTIIMEMSHGDKSRETRTMAIVMGMWGYGFLVNPAISGYLADPMRQYPDSGVVDRLNSVLNLEANPFLLPNLVGCFFCLLAYFCVRTFVEETLPEDKIQPFEWRAFLPPVCRRATPNIIRNISSFGLFKHLQFTEAETEVIDEERASGTGGTRDHGTDKDALPRWVRPSPSTTALTILSPRTTVAKPEQNSNVVDAKLPQAKGGQEEAKETATIKSLMQRPSTRSHLILNWIYAFLVITVDETFPLYCMSKQSGLGVEEKMIGNLLSGAGAVYVLIQYLLLTNLVDRYGFYKAMKIAAFFSVPTVFLVPVSLITNRNAVEGTLTPSTYALISVVYAVARAFSSVTFSTLTMTTNRTVPAHQRAAMNGLAMLGGSVGKAAGPVFAGLLFSTSVGRTAWIRPPWGSVVVWTIIACMGMGFFLRTSRLEEHGADSGGGASAVPTRPRADAAESNEAGPATMDNENEERPPSF